MRKYIALVIGSGMTTGGLYILYSLLFKAAVIKGLFFVSGGVVTFLGAYLVYDTIKRWKE